MSQSPAPRRPQQHEQKSVRFRAVPPDVALWLRRLAEERPGDEAYAYRAGEAGQRWSRSYGALDLEARRIAAWLRARGQAGDRVLLLHGPGPAFVEAFFGCLYAGMVAVPAYPPRKTRHGDRLAAVARDAQARLALADAAGAAALRHAAGDGAPWDGLELLEGSAPDQAPLPAHAVARYGPRDLAFLQYTSGSTGDPKGVMVTHGNLAHNAALQARSFGLDAASVMVSWLPLFHDLGLIMGVLSPLSQGARFVLLPPNAFLQRPRAWLEALSEEGGTHTAAPNFAYELCVSGIPAAERAGLDLSPLRFAVNGAEPVHAETLRRFQEAFGPCGLAATAQQPSYGLAENTLIVSAGPLGSPWSSRSGPGQARVGCGGQRAQRVRIVDPETQAPCAEGTVGEIWVRGRSVAAGYWGRPALSAETFGARLAGRPGRYLRTGDLGFWQDGRLHIAGRLKDLIIVRGANLYPQDLERCATESSADLKLAAAFGVEGPEGEAVILVQECRRRIASGHGQLMQGIVQALVELHGVRPQQVLLVGPGGVPRTSSGKVQRRACRDLFLKGQLPLLARWPGELSAASAPSDLEAWGRAQALALGGQDPDDLRAPLAAWGLDSLRSAELGAGGIL